MIVKVGLEGQVGVCQVERGDWKDTAGAEGCAEQRSFSGDQVARPLPPPRNNPTTLLSTSAEYF